MNEYITEKFVKWKRKHVLHCVFVCIRGNSTHEMFHSIFKIKDKSIIVCTFYILHKSFHGGDLKGKNVIFGLFHKLFFIIL